MEYSIYKLEFKTGVHFGTGTLNESDYTFQADQLFSALYIEALKLKKNEQLYEAVQEGRLLFSDAFPYIGSKYMLPKPMTYVEPSDRGSSEQKKAYKKLKFIPVEYMDDFMAGRMDISGDPMKAFGSYAQQTMAHVRNEGDTVPYRVGTFYYNDDCGLYIIAAHKGEEDKLLAEELMEALSYSGIGGKKSAGLGRFELKSAAKTAKLIECLQKKSDRSMLLSTALPKDNELEMALEGASYLLGRRSGYVASPEYADEWHKKKDLYVFMAGSCFVNRFEGDIYDVSEGGSHSVYRYAKPLFMGV